MRLIDADALLKKLNEERTPYNADINYIITNAPTVEDVAPVRRGRWMEREVIRLQYGLDIQSQRCSNCGKYHTTPYMYFFNGYNYCPWCGARMDGGDENEID